MKELTEQEFVQYRRTQIAEMRPVMQQETKLKPEYLREHYNISISPADIKNGSPKIGDMIARNPKNHNDQWLVAEQYFKDNFEPLLSKDQPMTKEEMNQAIEEAKNEDISPEITSAFEPVVGAEETAEQIVFFLKNNDLSIANQEQWVNDRLQAYASHEKERMLNQEGAKLLERVFFKLKCNPHIEGKSVAFWSDVIPIFLAERHKWENERERMLDVSEEEIEEMEDNFYLGIIKKGIPKDGIYIYAAKALLNHLKKKTTP